ncbi:MAG: tRNA (adenosine(37)-N6)-threonylcarbamoyltransferase complex ATPase subunit type 1 TsaE [Clostridia bacterium]|jgi:tRNA threonylcarbamoyladenosine biosynthesis protein TsaE|nr:tRNA (adenosine(37)-N6)-threonylcarbamoyltransferase complex ATPase subunit type 1 TsaE [Clostridia bacterium]
MKKVYISSSLEQTEKIGAEFAASLNGDEFIAMYGDLGAGKTAFVRGMASYICPLCRVSSPSYTLINEYVGGKFPLYHFDVYRITDDDALYSTGFYDYPGSGVCVCEWSENIPYAIPQGAIRITLEHLGENERRITVIRDQNEDFSD